MKIAFITYQGSIKYTAANGFDEIHDLLPFLKAKGLDIHPEIWDDAAVDWAQYDLALLRMPWDYTEKLEAFQNWLDKIEKLGLRLLNDYKIVRRNIDKHYLQQIADAGFDVIPSVFLEKNWHQTPQSLFELLNTDQIIIKPCVSAGSRNTIKLKQADDFPASLPLPLTESYIAQPFMHEVQEGEWSFLFFGGKYSHTVLKKPQTGDFRVQQVFGGSIDLVHPEQELIDKAASYLTTFAPDALYARVGGLMVDGRFMLMELELIEPFLYLAYAPGSSEHYYEAIQRHIQNESTR